MLVTQTYSLHITLQCCAVFKIRNFIFNKTEELELVKLFLLLDILCYEYWFKNVFFCYVLLKYCVDGEIFSWDMWVTFPQESQLQVILLIQLNDNSFCLHTLLQ